MIWPGLLSLKSIPNNIFLFFKKIFNNSELCIGARDSEGVETLMFSDELYDPRAERGLQPAFL